MIGGGRKLSPVRHPVKLSNTLLTRWTVQNLLSLFFSLSFKPLILLQEQFCHRTRRLRVLNLWTVLRTEAVFVPIIRSKSYNHFHALKV